MSVNITSIKFTDDYTGLPSGHGSDTGINNLMGCVGDFMYVTILFNVAWSITDSIFTFDNSNNTITLDVCSNVNIPDFADSGFQVGDTIVINGTSGGVNDGTYTITDIDLTTITVLEAISVTGVYANVNIYGATNINGLDFYYNQIGSNTQENFNSLTDTKYVQRFSGITSPLYYGTTYNLVPNATSQAWFVETVDGVSCVPVITSYGINAIYQQEFKIVFPFLITPLFLSNQLALLQQSYLQSENNNGEQFVTPDYFLNQTLSFIYQIDAKFNITNTTADHSTTGNVTFGNGNTAWFNTFFPTGVKLGTNYFTDVQYTFENITYTNISTNLLTAIDINNITNVVVDILHTGSGAMTADNYVVNFMWLPTNQGAYQNYSNADQTNFRTAFLHDRCKTHIGASSSNGDMFGTPTQAIQNVTGTTISGGARISFQINLGTLSKSTFTESNKDYLIWITPQSSTVTALEDSDRTAVICDVNKATLNTDDATLLTIINGGNINFYNYPDTYVNPFSSYTGFIGTYGLAKIDFLVKYGCNILSMETDIIVEVYDYTTGIVQSTFTLASWTNDTSGFYDGNISQISINQTNNLSLSTEDTYTIQSINRYNTLDTSTQYALEILYPFQIGYQWWQNVNTFAPMFFKYHTQYWPVYSQGYAGNNPSLTLWKGNLKSRIKLRQTWNILDTTTDITTTFIQYGDINAFDSGKQLPSNDYTVTTTDIYGNDLDGIFASDVPTQVQVVYTGSNLTGPVGSTLIGSITVNYTNGTSTVFDTLTTLDSAPETSNSLWNVPLLISVTTNQVILIGTINLQNSSSPVSNITVNSSLTYSEGVSGSSNLVTDSGDPIVTDGGNNIVVG